MNGILNKEAIKYAEILTLETIICCSCGIPFAVPSNYKRHLQQTQDGFYCPNGHRQSYTKSTADILREKLEKEQSDRLRMEEALKDRLRDSQNEAEAWKRHWETQLKEKKKAQRDLKRLNNGVCSCCNRSFTNLAEHIKNEHPELIGKEKPKRKYKTKNSIK